MFIFVFPESVIHYIPLLQWDQLIWMLGHGEVKLIRSIR